LKDYYQILGVRRTASCENIRKAFRCQAMVLHPDVNSTAEAKAEFQKINEAYQVLKNTEKRRIYDLRLQNGLFSQKIYYHPGRAARPYRPPHANHNSYRSTRFDANNHKPSAFEKAFDNFLLFFMLATGIGAIGFGIFNLTQEPEEGTNQFAGLIFGLVFTGLLLFLWEKKKKYMS